MGPGGVPSPSDSNDLFCPADTNAGFETKRQFPRLSSPRSPTSGLRTLDLPDQLREIIVLGDGDESGAAAARNCAWRWKREGRRVHIGRPPRGMDFRDMLVDRASRIEEGAQ